MNYDEVTDKVNRFIEQQVEERVRSIMSVDTSKVIDDLIAQNNQIRAENAMLVEAIETSLKLDICPETAAPQLNYFVCKDESHKVRRRALANTSEQARALLVVVEAVRNGDWNCDLKEKLAALDKLREGK